MTMKNNLLRFFLFFSFLCSSHFLNAQSINFVIDNPVCDNSGTVYTLTQSGSLNSKPEYTCANCYFASPIRLSWTGTQWELEDYSLSLLIAINGTDTPTPPCHTNFPWTAPTSFNCGVSSLTGDCAASVSSGASIPTLSEWGLIILALLLMTLGTLYLVQPNWREGLYRNS